MTLPQCRQRNGLKKQSYRSAAKARQAAIACANRRWASKLNVYECPRCGYWHLTSKEQMDDPLRHL